MTVDDGSWMHQERNLNRIIKLNQIPQEEFLPNRLLTITITIKGLDTRNSRLNSCQLLIEKTKVQG